MRETLELWHLADSLLHAVKTTNYAPRLGGGGIAYTSHSGWAIDFRAYATEAEHKALSAAIRGQRPTGLEQAVRSFRRRVPEAVIETGFYLLDR